MYRVVLLSIFVFLIFFSIGYSELPDIIGIIQSDTVLTNFGYRIVPLGDQNNDGFDDIIVWDYRFAAYLYYGGDPFDTIPALRIDSVNDRISNVGDINGDGFNEFAMLGRNPFSWKLNLYFGGPFIDTVRDMWFGADSLRGMGYTVCADDINSNGNNDLICWCTLQKSVLLFELGTDSDSIPDLQISPANLDAANNEYNSFGERIITGDFNGDGITDLVINLRPRVQQQIPGSLYLYWGGASFDTIPDMIINRSDIFQEDYESFGIVLENLGDFNGDGYDDFYAGNSAGSDSLGFIFFGGPDIDTLPDLTLCEKTDKARLAGDVNNDGYNDLITGYQSSWSGLGHAHIYLGGPDCDSIPDLSIYNYEFSGYQNYFAMDCAGIGDFNGDGIDDYAISALNADSRGRIYICSGWDDNTDLHDEDQSVKPLNFKLSQNYPNPFNPSTTIEFELMRKSNVELTVYDILGRRVSSLINQTMPAGSHKIRWDGRNQNGDNVASGIYFYKIKTDQFSDTKKMVLVR
ncbi:MAG: T9SS type A sorting domain-containing protein [Candidatus Zixiibacteriota bacterium]